MKKIKRHNKYHIEIIDHENKQHEIDKVLAEIYALDEKRVEEKQKIEELEIENKELGSDEKNKTTLENNKKKIKNLMDEEVAKQKEKDVLIKKAKNMIDSVVKFIHDVNADEIVKEELNL